MPYPNFLDWLIKGYLLRHGFVGNPAKMSSTRDARQIFFPGAT
jgi:hypothetical protein